MAKQTLKPKCTLSEISPTPLLPLPQNHPPQTRFLDIQGEAKTPEYKGLEGPFPRFSDTKQMIPRSLNLQKACSSRSSHLTSMSFNICSHVPVCPQACHFQRYECHVYPQCLIQVLWSIITQQMDKWDLSAEGVGAWIGEKEAHVLRMKFWGNC